MKTIISILTGLLVAGAVYAASYEVLEFPVSNVTTAGVSSATTVLRKGVDGKVVMYSFSGSTNMSFKVDTIDEYGMSIGGARVVQAAVTNTMGTNGVLGTAIYVDGDRVVASFYSSSNTNGTAVGTLKLLLEIK